MYSIIKNNLGLENKIVNTIREAVLKKYKNIEVLIIKLESSIISITVHLEPFKIEEIGILNAILANLDLITLYNFLSTNKKFVELGNSKKFWSGLFLAAQSGLFSPSFSPSFCAQKDQMQKGQNSLYNYSDLKKILNADSINFKNLYTGIISFTTFDEYIYRKLDIFSQAFLFLIYSNKIKNLDGTGKIYPNT